MAIVAAFLVAGALLPWELRLACAFGAIGIVLLLFVMRIRSHRVKVTKARRPMSTARSSGCGPRARVALNGRFAK